MNNDGELYRMVDVEFTPAEYGRLIKWYVLAFAQLDPASIKEADKKLKAKVEIMKEAEEYLLTLDDNNDK